MTAPSAGRPARAALAAVLVLAAALRLHPWLRPGGFLGLREYDDGVYYGAARLLLDGVVPYRDATLVHPPGITLLLLPFAALGRAAGDPAGMATARAAVLVVALVNVALVFRLAQQLLGVDWRGGTVAAAVYALSPNALLAEHTVLLEPITTLLALLAVTRLRPATAWADRSAGLLLAAAVSVKLFAGAYVVALALWLVARRERRRLLDVLAGLGAGLVVLVGPFLALAPAALWRDVVLTQVWRPVASTANGLGRVQDMAGLGSVPQALALFLLLGVVAAAVWGGREELRDTLVLWLLVLAITVAAFAQAATYYPHYGAFLAPALAVLVARVAQPRRGPVVVGACIATAVLASLAAGAWKVESSLPSQAGLAKVREAADGASCVWYEAASLAVAVDAFAVPTRACPGWVDQRGQLYASIGSEWAHRKDFYYRGFTSHTDWQNQVVEQMTHADVLLLSRSAEQIKEWAPATRSYVVANFHSEVVSDVPDGRSVQLWRRNAP